MVDPTPAPPVPVAAETESVPAPTEAAATSDSASDNAEEKWKAEYEALEASWKEVSSKERAHAEATRAKWEAIRAQEAKERKERGETEEEEIVSGLDWIGVGSSAASTIAQTASPAPTDARDLVADEEQGGKSKQELEASV